MTTLTKQRLDMAMRAVDSLFSTTSVPASETLEAMEELQAEIDSKIEALRGDVEDGRA